MTMYLGVDSVELVVLVLNFRAHVDGHVTQIADHGAHLAHVALHFILAGVLGDPATQCIIVNIHKKMMERLVAAGGNE